MTKELEKIRDELAEKPYGFEGTSLRESGFYKRGFNACYEHLRKNPSAEVLEIERRIKFLIQRIYEEDDDFKYIDTLSKLTEALAAFDKMRLG